MRSFVDQEERRQINFLIFFKVWSWALNLRAKGKEDKKTEGKGGFVALCSIKNKFFQIKILYTLLKFA